MKITLYNRTDNYSSGVQINFIDRNLIVNEGDNLPGMNEKFPKNGRKYVHFKSDYSKVYSHHSDKKVNTRITYFSKTLNKDVHVYCKLGFTDRIRLSFIEKNTIYHKHPVATLSLLLALVGILYGFYRDVFVYDVRNDKLNSRIEKIEDTILLYGQKNRLHHKYEFRAEADTMLNDTLP